MMCKLSSNHVILATYLFQLARSLSMSIVTVKFGFKDDVLQGGVHVHLTGQGSKGAAQVTAMASSSASENLKIGELLEVLEGHAGDVNSTAWSPTAGSTLCSCGGDRKIRVWTIDASTPPEKPAPVETITAHELYINSCAFNPSGDLLVTTSSDETVKIWSTVSWTCVGRYSGPQSNSQFNDICDHFGVQ